MSDTKPFDKEEYDKARAKWEGASAAYKASVDLLNSMYAIHAKMVESARVQEQAAWLEYEAAAAPLDRDVFGPW